MKKIALSACLIGFPLLVSVPAFAASVGYQTATSSYPDGINRPGYLYGIDGFVVKEDGGTGISHSYAEASIGPVSVAARANVSYSCDPGVDCVASAGAGAQTTKVYEITATQAFIDATGASYSIGQYVSVSAYLVYDLWAAGAGAQADVYIQTDPTASISNKGAHFSAKGSQVGDAMITDIETGAVAFSTGYARVYKYASAEVFIDNYGFGGTDSMWAAAYADPILEFDSGWIYYDYVDLLEVAITEFADAGVSDIALLGVPIPQPGPIVPLPASAVLLFGGMLALGGLGWSRRRAPAA